MLKEESNKPEKRRQARDQKAVGSKRQEMMAVIAGGIIDQSTSTLPPEEASIVNVEETVVEIEDMS